MKKQYEKLKSIIPLNILSREELGDDSLLKQTAKVIETKAKIKIFPYEELSENLKRINVKIDEEKVDQIKQRVKEIQNPLNQQSTTELLSSQRSTDTSTLNNLIPQEEIKNELELEDELLNEDDSEINRYVPQGASATVDISSHNLIQQKIIENKEKRRLKEEEKTREQTEQFQQEFNTCT